MQLHQKKEEFKEAEIQVVVISFESIESTRKYLRDTSLDWPVLLDDRKILYRYFDMGKVGFWDLWGFQTWRAYLREMLQGRFPRKGDGNIQQQGGNVILDPDGRIRLHHIGSGPGDRPGVNLLLRFVSEAGQEFRKETYNVNL